jgi:hypothetical protein
MAISNITIYQNNKVGDSDLLAVHSPLSFLVDVTYSGAVPDILYCDIYDETPTLLTTLKCIPYQDLTPTQRRFILIADSTIRGYMDDFDDFVQSENSFVSVPKITKIFELRFRDPDAGVPDVTFTFTAIHAAREFGESPNLSEVYNNDSDTYYAAKGETVYIYFYNDNASNVITIGIKRTIKFIVSDSGGFLENALISIIGEAKLTDANGEATFEVPDGSNPYTITKNGYIPVNGTLIVSGGDLEVPVTMTAQTNFDFVFKAGTVGYAGKTVNVYELSDPVTPIATGVTNGSGEVTLNLAAPQTYRIRVVFNTCDVAENLSNNYALESSTLNVTIPCPLKPVISVLFIVKDQLNNLLQGVAITNDSGGLFSCGPALTTDVNGEASTTVYASNDPVISKQYNYKCTKAGYTTFSSSIVVNSSSPPVTENVTLNSI